MKFMIMVFSEEEDLRTNPPEWTEQMTSFMAQLDDELAHSGELVYSEVLAFGSAGSLIDRHGKAHHGSFSGATKPLTRFWVVKVTDEERAVEIAASIAAVIGAAVEVRHVMPSSQRP
ncbi:YciI family protein [Homoserinimonas sp. OAct 916]|uniref:YciI family protein n=1 Tax=Homoserinimonas sp. OAct 916 TaxID=2211450 RepID=UPI0013003DEF|nr:YciI family protein [Homoserinimonas sp. OAct 916]